MSWEPITDLPNDLENYSNPELTALVTVWKEQSSRLKNSGAFKTYMERLQREIAIETGIIERLYDLDRGVTRLLIEHGIEEALIPHNTTNRPVQQVVALIRDQEAAIEGLFDFVGGQRELSVSYVRELHQALTRHQEHTDALHPMTGKIVRVPLLRGDWKKNPNNPQRPDGIIHQYAPPEQVASEMDKLISWHHEHQKQNVSPDVEAAWLHHRFTQIHPFQDGNGRVARLLASLVFIKAGWFPLIVTRDDRKRYIMALEKSDHGDLVPLIDLFNDRQKRAFIRSLGLSEQILADSRRTKTVIASITDKLRNGVEQAEKAKIQDAERHARRLFSIASDRLDEVADEIRLSIGGLVRDAQIFTDKAFNEDERSYYYRYQVVQTAKQLDYYANLRNYHSWIQLVIDVENRPTMILLSFHVLGYEHRGLLACSACAYHRDATEDGERNINEIEALTDSPFQFSYADQDENLDKRYKQWLEDALVSGLEYWNKSM